MREESVKLMNAKKENTMKKKQQKQVVVEEPEIPDDLTPEQLDRARFEIAWEQENYNPFDMESQALRWFVSEFAGEPWYSDGSATFAGTKKDRTNVGHHLPPDEFAKSMMPPVKEADRTPAHISEALASASSSGVHYLVAFSGNVYIQARYYFEAIIRFPDVQFYTGPEETTTEKGGHRYRKVYCESKGKLVGVIMPYKPPFHEVAATEAP
jgi:hypothetical protein